jgi:hypothetical protein
LIVQSVGEYSDGHEVPADPKQQISMRVLAEARYFHKFLCLRWLSVDTYFNFTKENYLSLMLLKLRVIYQTANVETEDHVA